MIIKNTRKEDAGQKSFIISCGQQFVNKNNLQISGMNFLKGSRIITIKVPSRLSRAPCGRVD
ncbi:MAG: hypothetical protein ABII25_05810 [bacterium]